MSRSTELWLLATTVCLLTLDRMIITDTATTTSTVITTTPADTTTTPLDIITTHVDNTATPVTTSPLECQYMVCYNGARCVVNAMDNSELCVDCPDGFTGNDCAIELNECSEFPCEPFGDCEDLVNDYSCTCRPGFTATNDTKYCEDINECLTSYDSSPCLNNATCVDEYNRFKCICPPDPDISGTYLVGLRCDNYTTADRFPVIEVIVVRRGILAGGANLTVVGDRLDEYPVLGAWFISDNAQLPPLYSYALPALSTHKSVVLISPRANSSYEGQRLRVQMEFSGPVDDDKSNTLYFEYTGNPNVSNMLPRKQLATGGIQLTVHGTNMDVVQNSRMRVTVMIRRYSQDEHDDGDMGEEVINYPLSVCELNVTDNMLCEMPVLNLPDEFLTTNDTRRSGTAIATLRTDSAIANVYVGLVFDNLPTFRNLSKSRPDISFTLAALTASFEPPSDEPSQFDPSVTKYLFITGKMLDDGCSSADYRITVGVGNCTVVDFSSNQITCEPPTYRPQANLSWIAFCDNSTSVLPLIAQVGADARNTLFAYCIEYKQEAELVPLIVVVTVVGVCLCLLLVIVVVCCVRRYRRQRASSADDQQLEEDYVELADQNQLYVNTDEVRHYQHYQQRTPGTAAVPVVRSRSRPQSIYPASSEQQPARNFTPVNQARHMLARRQNTFSMYPPNS